MKKIQISGALCLALAAWLPGGCTPTGDEPPPCGGCRDGERCDPVGVCVPDLPARCEAPTRWTPGTRAFRAARWGLAGLGAAGVRISAVDLDEDVYAVPVVRRAGAPEGPLAASPGTRGAGALQLTTSGARKLLPVISAIGA